MKQGAHGTREQATSFLEETGQWANQVRKDAKGPAEEDSHGPSSVCLEGSAWPEGHHGASDCSYFPEHQHSHGATMGTWARRFLKGMKCCEFSRATQVANGGQILHLEWSTLEGEPQGQSLFSLGLVGFWWEQPYSPKKPFQVPSFRKSKDCF